MEPKKKYMYINLHCVFLDVQNRLYVPSQIFFSDYSFNPVILSKVSSTLRDMNEQQFFKTVPKLTGVNF